MKYGHKLVALSCLGLAIASQACSDDDDATSDGNAGEATGGSSTAGKSAGGKSSGGAAGTSSGGNGGVATAGKNGTGGNSTAGTGGTNATAGTAGTGGTAGTAGTAGTGGTAIIVGGQTGMGGAAGDGNGGDMNGGSGGEAGGPMGSTLGVGLLLHYTFDEASTTFVDSSGNNRTGHIPAFQWIPGKDGNALHITSAPPSAPDRAPVLLPATGITDGVTDFTIGVWIRPSVLNQWERVFDFGTGEDNYTELTPKAGDNGDKPEFELVLPTTPATKIQVKSSVPMVENAWQHLAVSQSGGTITLYLNGVSVGSATNVTHFLKEVGATTSYLGKSHYPDAKYEGDLDDFRMYKRALSATELLTLAGLPGGTAVAPDNLAIHYKFDEAAGFAVADSSGNNKDAVIEHKLAWVDGKHGKAVSLAPLDHYIAMPADVLKNVTDFTMAAWVKEISEHDWAQIFDIGTDQKNYATLIAHNGQTKVLRFSIQNNGEEFIDGPALAVGTWTHVAVTHEGTTATMYVNGVDVNAGIISKMLANNGSTTNNWLGRSEFNDSNFDGALDDVRIYSRALTPAEVAELAGL